MTKCIRPEKKLHTTCYIRWEKIKINRLKTNKQNTKCTEQINDVENCKWKSISHILRKPIRISLNFSMETSKTRKS